MGPRWEVALALNASRWVIARDVLTRDLPDAIAEAQARIDGQAWPVRVPALSITRSDQTSEALQERRDRQFWKFDKAGRRRRAYKRPGIEKDWEAWAKEQRKRDRAAAAARKLGAAPACPECEGRWSALASRYGLVHACGWGLVDTEVFDSCSSLRSLSA